MPDFPKQKTWGPLAMLAGAALLAFGVKDYLIESETRRPGPLDVSTTRGEIEIAIGAILLALGFGLFLLRSREVTAEDEDEDEVE